MDAQQVLPIYIAIRSGKSLNDGVVAHGNDLEWIKRTVTLSWNGQHGGSLEVIRIFQIFPDGSSKVVFYSVAIFRPWLSDIRGDENYNMALSRLSYTNRAYRQGLRDNSKVTPGPYDVDEGRVLAPLTQS